MAFLLMVVSSIGVLISLIMNYGGMSIDVSLMKYAWQLGEWHYASIGVFSGTKLSSKHVRNHLY